MNATERLSAALRGRYDIEGEIGRGGMATVYRARDLRHGRAVALKILHPELAGAIGVDRFVREVRLTARLQHPGILPVLDSGVLPAADGLSLPWYAMPYLEGESLRTRLAREGQLPVDVALAITSDAADALAYAHRHGIVHRDIKPENILLADSRAYVVDFGIAKALLDTGGNRLTSTGFTVGTPGDTGRLEPSFGAPTRWARRSRRLYSIRRSFSLRRTPPSESPIGRCRGSRGTSRGAVSTFSSTCAATRRSTR